MANRENQYQIAIIEHDLNGDDLCVWQFPSISDGLIPLLEKQSAALFQTETTSGYAYFKHKTDWIYIWQNKFNTSNMPDLKGVSIISISRLFLPEIYLRLLKLFYTQYYESCGDPTKLLEAYLSIFTTGTFSNKSESFDIKALTKSQEIEAYKAVSVMKSLIHNIGMESVILWNAILLEKRVLVYGESIDNVMQVVRTLPQLAWHRRDWSILRPIVLDDANQLEDLQSSGSFIAGTTSSTVSNMSTLFDVIVSLSDHRVTVMPAAASFLRMCSVHKDIAAFLLEVAGNIGMDASAKDQFELIVEPLHQKTTNIINNLRALAEAEPNKKLSDEAIASVSANESTQQWLRRLAIVEGLL